MGKRDDLKRQIDDLTKQYNAADDDDDLEIAVEKDGHRVHVKGRHARRVMRRLGLDDDDQGDAGKGDQGDQGDDDDDDDDQGDAGKGDAGKGAEQDGKPAASHRYFR